MTITQLQNVSKKLPEPEFTLEEILTMYPRVFVDTNILLHPSHVKKSIITTTADTSNPSLISPEEVAENINYLQTIISHARKPSFCITPEILIELKNFQEIYSASLKFYRKKIQRKIHHRNRHKMNTNFAILSPLQEFGGLYNHFIQAAQHKIHRPKNKVALEELVELYQTLKKEGVIREKQTTAHRRQNQSGIPRKPVDPTNDFRIISHTLYSVIIDKTPTALVSGDSDMFQFLPIGIQALLYHQPENIAAQVRKRLENNPLDLYDHSSKLTENYSLRFTTTAHLPTRPLSRKN